MKYLYTLTLAIAVFASCSSPSKKQQQDKEQRINELQNVGSGAIENENKAVVTDSTQTDTTNAR